MYFGGVVDALKLQMPPAREDSSPLVDNDGRTYDPARAERRFFSNGRRFSGERTVDGIRLAAGRRTLSSSGVSIDSGFETRSESGFDTSDGEDRYPTESHSPEKNDGEVPRFRSRSEQEEYETWKKKQEWIEQTDWYDGSDDDKDAQTDAAGSGISISRREYAAQTAMALAVAAGSFLVLIFTSDTARQLMNVFYTSRE